MVGAKALAEPKKNGEITLTFPDGTARPFVRGVTGREVAESISKSLAKAAIIVRLDGEDSDLSCPIERDAKIEIIKSDDELALELIRHDCAHVMAEAVQKLFPGTQVTIGPVIENGFFYDFARNEPFSTEELAGGIDQPRWLAQKMAYCLRNMGAIDVVGKSGNSILYSILL